MMSLAVGSYVWRQANAATFTNYTQYYQLYPKAYFPLALELEADRMSNLLLRQQDFEPEIKVVMEERRQRTDDNPRALAFERFKWIAYPTSHYRQPIIGHMKNLQSIQLQDVQAWYKKWYRPNNAILVIVGDVDTQTALLQVQKYFGDIAATPMPPRNDVLEFEQLGYRHMELSSSCASTQFIYGLECRVLWLQLKTRKMPMHSTISNILLDSGISSRLEQTLGS